MASIFITLEGIDGCGKTTQGRLLADWLRERGHCVQLTREPGGTPAGEWIRELVLSKDSKIPPEAELFLYLADRAIHVEQVIRPALQQGCTVVCERYTDSTLAYQGFGRGLDLELLRRLDLMATGGLKPDLTLALDITPREARLDVNRLDRLESEGEAFLGRVADGFRQLAQMEPDRVKLIAARSSVEIVHAAIVKLASEVLDKI